MGVGKILLEFDFMYKSDDIYVVIMYLIFLFGFFIFRTYINTL